MIEKSKEYKDRYGAWAGNERGYPPDYARCAQEVQDRDGWFYFQCSRKRGHGPDKAYCKQHAEMK